jgi:hypothetical protein
MNTATVLLENVIQGLQTIAWMLLLLFSFVDFSAFSPLLTQQNITATGLLIIAVCYWLGILVDTAYYHLFIQSHEDRWAKARIPAGEPSLSQMVFRCIVESGDLAKLLLERQAHLRMLRVSIVNLVFIVLSALVFLDSHPAYRTIQANLLVFGFGTFAFVCTAYSWRKLYGYYITIAKISYDAIIAKATPFSAHSTPNQARKPTALTGLTFSSHLES